MERPELSIIVPVLNEAENIEHLFVMLALQQEIVFELVVCDGGSTDGTAEKAYNLAELAPYPVKLAKAGRGRGRQMNAGFAASEGKILLFLHADSSFADPLVLRQALDAYATAIASRGDKRIAGHFRLHFTRTDSASSLPYYFYEWKARLQRKGCIHGDQGLLINRDFFGEIGGFDEKHPILEDVFMAEKIGQTGKWLLLPADIITSARRFETEGLRERQTLNAILLNFAAAGWEPFLREIPHIYRTQDRAERLRLAPILQHIRKMMGALPLRERLLLWYETGRYVRANAWQIPLFLDARFNFRRGAQVGTGRTRRLDIHDRFFDRLTDNTPGRAAATLLTWAWFRMTLLHASIQERRRHHK